MRSESITLNKVSLGLLVLVCALLGTNIAYAQEAEFQRVSIDSLSDDVKLNGYLMSAGSSGKAPAAIFSPACGGITFPHGFGVRPFYRDMAEHLVENGYTVLLIDGFKPRGTKEVCSIPASERHIDTTVRMLDSFAGLNYLRKLGGVDPDRIFLLTWGAAGSFEAMNSSEYLEQVGGKGFSAAVMFYPKCDSLNDTFAPYAPIQVFVGEEDAWNDPQYCERLKEDQKAGSAEFNLKIFPGAYHGFDHRGKPKMRTDAVVGEVMVGGNLAVKREAYQLTTEFLARFTQ